MDHASAQRRDPLERRLHVGNGEVGQRSRIARADATLVNAEGWSLALGLPAAPFGLAPLGDLNTE